MLCIYWADLEVLAKTYEEKLNILHISRAEKLVTYKMQDDKIRGLGAGLLLEKALEDYLAISGKPKLRRDAEGRYDISYEYGSNGKPYLKEYPDIYFSLSHSGMRAAVALSDKEVGLDVQLFQGYKERIAKRFYHKKEQALLENQEDAKDREHCFYRIWCGKEAYIKFTGKGMGEDLRNFYVDVKRGYICEEENIVLARYDCFGEKEREYEAAIVYPKESKGIDKIIKIYL